MKRWLSSLAIMGFIVPAVGCSPVARDAPAASPALTNTHAECEETGGLWHPGLKYCEYRTPGSPAPLLH
jgi:hypothetical protein